MRNSLIETWNYKNVDLIHIYEDKHSPESNLIIAEKIKKIEPDIIVFELPRRNSMFDEINSIKPNKITSSLISAFKLESKQIIGNFCIIIDALQILWEKQKKVELLRFDAPIELTSYCVNLPSKWTIYGIVWNFIREKYMAFFINENIDNFKDKSVIIQCHNNHWERIKRLLANSDDVFEYYFVHYAKDLNVDLLDKHQIDILLKEKHKLLYDYWIKVNDFNFSLEN